MKKIKKRPKTMAKRTPRQKIEEHFPDQANTMMAAKLLEEMHEEVPPVKVPDRLAALGDIYRERNAVYGDSFRTFGVVMIGLFPQGLELRSVDDWNRLSLVTHMVDKLVRYSFNFTTSGGHIDSLDDIAVYSQILQMLDLEKRTEREEDDIRT